MQLRNVSGLVAEKNTLVMRKVANSLIIRLPQLFSPYQFGEGGKVLPQPRGNRVLFLTGPFKGKVSRDRYFSQKSIKLHITYICTFLMCALDCLHLRIVYSCCYEINNKFLTSFLCKLLTVFSSVKGLFLQ
jgi:hypothetical protein